LRPGYQCAIEMFVKTMIKTFFSATLYSRNPSDQELRQVMMQVYTAREEPGRYRFNSVWTRFEVRLCVTAFPECRPHSKLF
jgi:hypothetical protein